MIVGGLSRPARAPISPDPKREFDDALMDAALDFRHVDVFADVPFAGNGLIVLFGETPGARTEALISGSPARSVG
jgi:hypothetical protein